MPTRQQKAFDELVDDALKVFRLAASQKTMTANRLEKLKRKLAAEIASDEYDINSKAKLAQLFKRADKLIDEAYVQLQLELDPAEVAENAAYATVGSLEAAIGREALKLPTAAYFSSVASNVLIEGAPSSEWWKRQAATVAFQFSNQVRQGLANAETNQQIISRIVGKNGQPGVMDIAKHHAAALVQTSVQAVANDARRATFDANDDVIKGLKQVSTLDGKTSLICVSYSGAEWNLKREPINGTTQPFNGGCPRHWNCRSLEIPILKTFRELGLDIDEAPGTTRASADGPIDVNTSFEDFLNRRGKAYQDEMLGEGRADLWREGKITLKDLVDGRGRPLSLAELQKVARPSFTAGAYMKRYDQPDVTPASILESFPANTKDLIAGTEAKLAKLTDTELLHKKDGVWTPERVALHNKILYEGVEGLDPDTGGTKFYPGLLNRQDVEKAISKGSQPTFTILGGRGGSGKSSFSGKGFPEAKVYDKDNVLLFDSDAVKHMLPEFKGFNANQVHEESSFVLDRAIQEAKKLKVNVVLDGTMKSYKGAFNKISEFKADGYRTEMHYMHLPRQEAAKRAVSRYLTKKNDGSGRYVPASIILGNTDNELNFDKLKELVDNWSFRDNNVARGTAPKLIAQKERKK